MKKIFPHLISSQPSWIDPPKWMKTGLFSKQFIVITICALMMPLQMIQAETQTAQSPVSTVTSPMVDTSKMWLWVNQPWSGDNKPYHLARIKIDLASTSMQNLKALETKYQSLYQQKPDDPLRLFCWAYTAYQVAHQNSNVVDMRKHLSIVSDTLDAASFPKTYDYARIHFLIDEVFYAERRYKGLGERLIKRDPLDYSCKYELASLLLEAYPKPDYRQVLVYIHELIQQSPRKPIAYSLLGEVYVLREEITKNKSYRAKAVAAYKQYIAYAPPNDEFSKVAKRIIHRLQQ